MVFCNKLGMLVHTKVTSRHNPYFNRWFSAIYSHCGLIQHKPIVTILILIDGFLQSNNVTQGMIDAAQVTILILIDGFLQLAKEKDTDGFYASHNPYFNRWFSAITDGLTMNSNQSRHNPYFNRWFSAMREELENYGECEQSQSLF